VLLEGKEPADEGAPVYAGGSQVGVVTCAMYSPLARKSMGIARLSVDTAVAGTPLEIGNKSGSIKATAQPLPFDDPKKTKRTAKG
jgi:aminomethyltransferase